MTNLQQITLTDQQLLAMVDRIAAEPGRNEKERYLADLAATTDGRMLIDLCYNSFLTWGVTQKSRPARSGPEHEAASMLVIKGLLMKLASRELSGHAAREAVDAAFGVLSPAAGELLWRCLNKDLKAGVAESSIKAVDPSLIPTFAVMRAHPYEEKRIKDFPVAMEPKLDGHRVTFIAKDGSGGFFTRTGKIIADLDPMVEPTLMAIRHWANLTRLTGPADSVDAFLSSMPATMGIPQIVLDGEMMPDSGQFNDVKGSMKNGAVVFHIFDMLSWMEFDAMGAVEVTYAERRMRVDDLIRSIEGTPMAQRLTKTKFRIARSHDEIQQIYQEHRAFGHEGAMVKKLDGFYHKKKSHDWLKLKNEDTEDLPVIGVFQGQAGGKYESTVGGLIVDRNGVEVRVSGIDDVARQEMWQLWGQTCAAVGLDPNVGYKGHTFTLSGTPGPLLGRLIEVEYHEITPDGSLRHPRFIRWRDDKTGEIEK